MRTKEGEPPWVDGEHIIYIPRGYRLNWKDLGIIGRGEDGKEVRAILFAGKPIGWYTIADREIRACGDDIPAKIRQHRESIRKAFVKE